jgi:hypothetical protein
MTAEPEEPIQPSEHTDSQAAPTASIDEALAAAVGVVNLWLQNRFPGLALGLEAGATIKGTVQQFVDASPGRIVSHWDWENFFHKQVKHKRNAWLFSVRRGGQPVALCLGKVHIRDDHVALEYLERRSDAVDVKGLPVQVGYAFAAAVANVLGLSEVRINQPFPELVTYYADALGMEPVRQKENGPVNYLLKKVKP